MNHRKKRGVGVLMLGAGVWLTTFGCGGDDDEGPQTAGTHQGGASTGGTAGRSGGAAGTAAGGDAQHDGTAGGGAEHGGTAGADTGPGGAAGSMSSGGMQSNSAGQGGTSESGAGGQTVGVAGSAGGDGGNASGGAAGNGQAGEQATGRVDCGGQSCDRCCYNPGIAPEIAKEFECDATLGSDVYLCGFMPRFEMTCDSKSDCREGLVCCMEETKVSLLAVAACSETCPAATSTWSHYELCANDQECTAPKHCVKIPNRYFRACQ